MSIATYDHARFPGMELDVLERFLSEIRYQPAWRRVADKECAYYDGNQLDSAVLAAMEKLGIPPLVTNLIAPTIDVVLGMEAKTRSDWRVEADTEEDKDSAEALNVKLMEAERESLADTAISDAYASQIKAGLGWVEVTRETDPFRYPYRVEHVHRNEIWWDWQAKRRDLMDARYLVRKQWKDKDILKLVFPKKADLIEMVQRFDRATWDDWVSRGSDYQRDFERQFGNRLDQSEWWDGERERLMLYEVWYRVYTRAWVMKLPDGRAMEVDLKNPRHARAILQNMVQPFQAVFPKMRLAYWIGPHRIADIPVPRNHFPYVPFWGKREDATNIPYGLIRSMMSPQDEINARDAKMMWMLSARRVRVDEDAVKDHERARRELARPDAYILLNPNRKPDSKFEVDDNVELSEQQFKVREERKHALQAAAGIFQEMLGKAGNAESGIAIASLVEQSSTTLAEINDNYRFGRRLVGEYLLELVREDIGPNTRVETGGKGRPRKEVLLNVPAKDQFGDDYMENNVQRDLYKVALDDVPSSPAYQTQLFQRLAEMTKAMPPQAQAVIAPFIIRASQLPDRHRIADLLLKALGIPDQEGGQDPEKAQLQQVVQQLVGALQQAEQALTDKEDFENRKLAIEEQRLADQRRKTEIAALDADTRRSAVDVKNTVDLIKAVLAGVQKPGASAPMN